MFNIPQLRRKTVNHAITPNELAVEDQQWTDLLQCIKGHKESLGHNSNSESFQLLLDLSKVFLIVLSKGTEKELRSDITNVVEEMVSYLLELDPVSWTATQEHCFALLSFITATYSAEILPSESLKHRESILNALERFAVSPTISSAFKFKRAENQYTSRPMISLNYAKHDLVIRPPSLHAVAQLCCAMRYRFIATHARNFQCGIASGGSITTYEFIDDWKRSVFLDPSRMVKGMHGQRSRQAISHGYTSGSFQGLWEGAFFTPFIIKWESEDMSQEPGICTCQMSMQYHIREYHSFDIEDTVQWTEEDKGGESQARAWFPERMEWYESLWGLMIYDSTKDRWVCYHPASAGEDSRQVLDTVIVGIASDSILPNLPFSHANQSAPTNGSGQNKYKIHGRVRREDGLVAFVRQPVFTTSDYLGTWLFEGHVLGGKEFVGDWRVTSRPTYSPGEQGWFTLSKARENA